MRAIFLTSCLVAFGATNAFAISAKDAVATAIAKFVSHKKTVEIVLTLPEGTKLNYDGPWKLVLNGGVVDKGGATAIRSLSEFNKNERTFNINIPNPTALSKEKSLGGFELTYFICDLKVTWCKRAILKGDIQL